MAPTPQLQAEPSRPTGHASPKARAACAVAALAALLVIAGCGSSSAEPAAKPRGPSSAALRQQLAAATNVTPGAFPAAAGRSLQQISDALGAAGPQLALATSVVQVGKQQRLAFGVTDQGQSFVYAPTVVYVARKKAKTAQGPFPAPADLLITDPPFRSRTAAAEKDVFAAIYDARVDFDEPGTYQVLAASQINGRLVGSGNEIEVKRPGDVAIPDVGEPAPRVPTDTKASAGGDIKAIETRVPPDSQHDVDLTDVIGKRPVALLFATPGLCESRVCGPVVDIAEQLKRRYGDRVAFIHQEVFVDNRIEKGLRPPLRAFKLQTEPWLFTLDRTGKIAARLEGSFGFRSFEEALKAALR